MGVRKAAVSLASRTCPVHPAHTGCNLYMFTTLQDVFSVCFSPLQLEPALKLNLRIKKKQTTKQNQNHFGKCDTDACPWILTVGFYVISIRWNVGDPVFHRTVWPSLSSVSAWHKLGIWIIPLERTWTCSSSWTQDIMQQLSLSFIVLIYLCIIFSWIFNSDVIFCCCLIRIFSSFFLCNDVMNHCRSHWLRLVDSASASLAQREIKEIFSDIKSTL